MKRFVFLIISLFLTSALSAQSIRGFVKNSSGQALPGVNIYIKNTNTGVISDENGFFILPISSGDYVLVFRMLGYETLENEVQLNYNSTVKMDAVLNESALLLNEAIVVADNRDLARSIMKNVRKQRRKYLESVSDIRYHTYRRQTLLYSEARHLKDSLERATNDSIMASMGYEKLSSKEKRKLRRKMRKIKKGKLKAEQDTLPKDTSRVVYVAAMNEIILYEYSKGNKFYESVSAENEYKARPPDSYIYISLGDDIEGISVDNIQYVYHNPYLFFDQADSWDFNFYKTTFKKNMLTTQPLVSPLSPTGALNYRYEYAGLKYKDSLKIFILKVDPLFPNDALFSGYISIYDSSFALDEIDLTINPKALLYCKYFHINQKYFPPLNGKSIPSESMIEYQIKEGKRIINGAATSLHLAYTFDADSMNYKNKSGEVRFYMDDALEKDSIWWENNRNIPLTAPEQKYLEKIDSLKKWYASDEYLFRIDSSYNHISIWRILLRGVGFRNRKNQTRFYINPLVSQLNFFGIGGYRHNVSGRFKKRFNNDFLLETEGMLDYGFRNNDIRGKAGLGFTYVPKKFVRTFIRFGDYYDMVNTNASVSSIFSRSNYVRTQTFSIAQRMEVVNGLFAELSFEYSDQTPINEMDLSNWSDQLFGNLNEPMDFDRYKKTEFKLNLVYRIQQKYMMKGRRKILLGSKWPDLMFTWRKGVPNLFGSEVNFDYLEIGFGDDVKLNRWGSSNFSFMLGSFVNRNNLRLVEYKYFRGSDPYFFSDPVHSFQLLGPTLSSSSAFMRGNYIHHFEGAILGKIPLISKVGITLAGGTGFLLMEENNFHHFEFFAGLEKVIRIRRELFRFGIYAVTADNNFSDADFTLKIGVNFFDTYSKKWDY